MKTLIVNFLILFHIFFLVFLLLTLNKQMLAGFSFSITFLHMQLAPKISVSYCAAM